MFKWNQSKRLYEQKKRSFGIAQENILAQKEFSLPIHT